MNDKIKQSLIKELSTRYGKEVKVKDNNIFVVQNAGTATSPIIPEEVDQIINRVGTVSSLRTGQLAYTIINGNLVIQYAP